MIMIWQQWEGTATTVANHSTSPPPKAILAQGPFLANAILAQGHFWLKAIWDRGHFGSRPSDGGAGGGDGDGGAAGDRDE